MSNLYQRSLSLAGIDVSGLSEADLRSLVRSILEAGIHGLCFSPYVGEHGPGTPVIETLIRERLERIAPFVRWVRSFSTTEGHELIPAMATRLGLGTVVGAWIDGDLDKNEIELSNAIEIARAGHARIVAVGNEVLLRGELDEGRLIEYIERVKAAVPGIEVGYVDAYFKFVDHPRVTEACDVILANCYPFWEGCPAEYAHLYMKDMYHRAARVAQGKRTIIAETGWPNRGTPEAAAVPSLENAMKYFIDTFRWAGEEGVEVFYFSAYDEAWKVAAEGDVGAFWGLWDANGDLKYV